MNKICAVYKITNSITGDFYIGSSKDVKRRLADHKCLSTWKQCPNNPLYLDFQKYGLNKFAFEILEEVEEAFLKKTEQNFIETLNPTYNNRNAKGLNIERRKEYNKEYQKEYQKSDKGKERRKEYQKSDKFKKYQKEYSKEYQKSDKFKKYQKEYYKSDRGKESLKKSQNKYQNQLCSYNGEILTLGTLSKRFQRAGIDHPTIEAKKYLIKDNIKE